MSRGLGVLILIGWGIGSACGGGAGDPLSPASICADDCVRSETCYPQSFLDDYDGSQAVCRDECEGFFLGQQGQLGAACYRALLDYRRCVADGSCGISAACSAKLDVLNACQ
jgi:hypothetical protein